MPEQEELPISSTEARRRRGQTGRADSTEMLQHNHHGGSVFSTQASILLRSRAPVCAGVKEVK